MPLTAPGDRVRVEVVRERKRWCRAELVDLLVSGPGRSEPLCPLYGDCGGCSLQHLDYSAQLHWKGRIVADALTRIGGRPTNAVPVIPTDPPIHYRNRLSLALRRLPGRRVVAGFRHRTRPGHVLNMSGECVLPEERLLDTWQSLRSSWGPTASRLPMGREIRISLRLGHDGVALSIRGGGGDGDGPALLADVAGLRAVFREEERGVVHSLAGASSVVTRWLGEEVELVGSGFQQVNSRAGQTLHAHVVGEAWVGSGSTVVDAYCGSGILGHLLAKRGASVVGIEADTTSVEVARRWTGDNFRVISGRVEDHLADVLPADTLILNPPRAGLDPTVPELLQRIPASRIVYVSCDPATLARDIKRLGATYEIRKLTAFDLFPQTAHVEVVATIEGPGEVAS